MTKLVAVYSFKECDVSTDRNDKRPIKGTADAIERARGVILEGTKEMVDESLLDGAGFYRRSN